MDLKNAIFGKIRERSLYAVAIAAVALAVVVVVGLFAIRRSVLSANARLAESAASSVNALMAENTDGGALVNLEGHILDLSQSALSSTDRNILAISLVLAVTAVLLVIAAMLAIRQINRRIGVPISQLTADAETIEAGDLGDIFKISSGDELEELASTFNSMIASIKQITAEKELTEKASKEKVHEITEEKHTLEAAHRQLRTILDSLPFGIRILSLDDWTLLYSNRACMKIFNCSSFEEQAKGQAEFGFLPELQPDGRNSIGMMRELIESGKGVTEMRYLRLGGEPFYCRSTDCIIEYEGHRASLAAMEDVTAEHEYLQKLEAAALKEQEANKLKSRFLATMSHEIRTPMNAIIGMSDLALQSAEPVTKDEHIFTVKQAASNLLAIINDILDFSKIESGRLEINPSEYSVASLISDVISIIRMRTLDTGLHFAVRVDSNIPCTLYGDETRIRQVLINLLSNAVKYTDKGSVSFGVYLSHGGEPVNPAQIDSMDKDTVNLIFEVIDTGIGIKPNDLKRLFTDFSQLGFTSSRDVEGVGLGLAITHSIVTMMGGSISVRSEYGVGSTFTVALPQKARTGRVLAKARKPKGKSVLIYVQNETYTDSLAWAVENLGVACDHASSAASLNELLQAQAYTHLFISHALLLKNEDTILAHAGGIKIAIIADFGETIPEKGMDVIVMPALCNRIADVLNGVSCSHLYADDNVFSVRFTAPAARVLLVDDIYTNLKVAEGLLAPYKMRVDTCTGGIDAVEAMQMAASGSVSERYDLVFMDHKMPKVDGVEATKRIRGIKAPGADTRYCQNVPIVALTANAVEDAVEMFYENGLDDFISKPIDKVKLDAVLEKWIPKDKQRLIVESALPS